MNSSFEYQESLNSLRFTDEQKEAIARRAAEAARQIRLRNLSGILLIDFIDMQSDADRGRVLAAMEQAASDDRVKTVIHGFTSLGLLEMTRKRTRDTLSDTLTQPCDACHATGRVRRD